jgi:hypothetical protein
MLITSKYFNLVQNHIKEYLQNQSTTSGINEYIQMLAANSEIKGFDFKDPSAILYLAQFHALYNNFA